VTEVEKLLAEADSFGELQVIRDVAHRAGLLWICPRCLADNFGYGMVCSHCTNPAPDGPTARDQWTCVCGMRTVLPQCRACHRRHDQQTFSQVKPGA